MLIPSELFKKHLSRLYGFFMAAIGLASTLHYSFVYDPKHPVNFYEFATAQQAKLVNKVFYILIYLLATIMLTSLFFWLHLKPKTENVSSDENDDNKACNIIEYDGEGFNMYLKGGVTLFCAVSVSYNIIRIVNKFENSFYECGGVAYLIFCITQAIFIVLLTMFFIFHDRVVVREPTFFVRLIFTHLLVCCLCTWFHSGIGEIREGLQSRSNEKTNGTNVTMRYCDDDDSYLKNMLRSYMLPCLNEFSIQGCIMAFDLLERMDSSISYEKSQNESSVASYPMLHKARRGVAIGSFVVFYSLAFVIIVYHVERFNAKAAVIVFTTQSMLYCIFGIIISGFTYWKMRHLHLNNAEGTAVERHLLWISYFGSLLYEFFSIIRRGYSLPIVEAKHRTFLYIDVLNSHISLLEVSLQLLVILNVMHRTIRHQHDLEEKPGRGLITLLLCLNLSFWIIHVFEVKKSTALNDIIEESFSIHVQVSSLCQYFVLPVVLLYRFHSTVCLSVAWSRTFDEEHATAIQE